MKLLEANCNFEREPLVAPFGFKGGYLSELWQSIVKLTSDKGSCGIGLGVQSTLWSDAEIFANNSESAGNEIMFSMTSFAARKALELDCQSPIELIDKLLPLTYEYGKSISGNKNLRLTFALNSLVAVDNAAWLVYCSEHGITNFDDIIPAEMKPAMSYRHDTLASIPLISYGVSVDDIGQALDDGAFLLKIKIGSDPDKDGDLDKMVEWDKNRLSEIHAIVKDRETPYTEDGHYPYYLDANGRYDSKERLMKFMDHADKIGALDRILILEEPFPEDYKEDVSEIPVRIAADESAHSDVDAVERIELGYGAIALKPIAKTLSMTLKIIKIAHEKGVPCFCADLTVNPIMVDWNKNVAARIESLPGLKIGLLETNGHQNYKNWQTMQSYHPCFGSSWTQSKQGIFTLTDEFYSLSGGIFQESQHYKQLVSD